MQRRARRITIGAAALGAAVLAAFVIAYWGPVLDHVEAWHFQLARGTETFQPPLTDAFGGRGTMTLEQRASAYRERSNVRVGEAALRDLTFRIAASQFRCPVIFDPEDAPPHVDRAVSTLCNIRGFFERNGWRVIEQRFPRRAYVLVRARAPDRREAER